jgi:hypothetical protein
LADVFQELRAEDAGKSAAQVPAARERVAQKSDARALPAGLQAVMLRVLGAQELVSAAPGKPVAAQFAALSCAARVFADGQAVPEQRVVEIGSEPESDPDLELGLGPDLVDSQARNWAVQLKSMEHAQPAE